MKYNKHGNLVFDKAERQLRAKLAGTDISEEEFQRIVDAQIAQVHAARSLENPDWQVERHEPVEVMRLRGILSLDGLVRRKSVDS